jgi:hypothetical protein
MGVLDTEASFKSKVAQIGRAALNTLFPKDIEYYFLAIELVDSQGYTVDYFAWPILPDEISETQTELTNVRKTMGGVNVLKNPTFNPRQISIRGDFGRRFKLLLGGKPVEFAGFSLSMQNGKFTVNPPNILDSNFAQFSSFVKSGYGCIKVLESIKEKSKKLDNDQKPFALYLYNPILGNNYQVEFTSFNQKQDKHEYNMRPMYNIQLTAVAPLDSVLSRKANLRAVIKNLSLSNLQKQANSISSGLRSAIGL